MDFTARLSVLKSVDHIIVVCWFTKFETLVQSPIQTSPTKQKKKKIFRRQLPLNRFGKTSVSKFNYREKASEKSVVWSGL